MVAEVPLAGLTFGGNVLADGSQFSVGSQRWEIDYDYAYDTAASTTGQPLASCPRNPGGSRFLFEVRIND